MKKVRNLIIVLAVLLTGTLIFAEYDDIDSEWECPGFANGYGRGGAYGMSYRMRDELNLSSEQYEKINAIAEKYAELRYNNRGDRDKMIELHEAQRKEVMAILTSEQKEKYNSYAKSFRGRGNGPRRFRGRNGGGGFCCG